MIAEVSKKPVVRALPTVLEQAVYEHGSADFPECLFWAQYQRMGCRAMLTFDAKAARMDGVALVGQG